MPDTQILIITVLGIVLVPPVTYVLALRARISAGGRLAGVRDRLVDMRAGLDRTITPVGAFVVLASTVLTVVTGIMYALGRVVPHLQPLDWIVFRWIAAHQTDGFTAVMSVVTQMGNKYQCWVVSAVLVVVYALVAPRRRWVALLVLGAMIVLQHYQQVGIADVIQRGHPPDSGGTFPSGASARVAAIYGTGLFLILRTLGVSRRVWAGVWALIAVLMFVEGWSRVYLNAHWVGDVPPGWLNGVLMLLGFVFAAWNLVPVRSRRPPAEVRAGPSDDPAGRSAAARRR